MLNLIIDIRARKGIGNGTIFIDLSVRSVSCFRCLIEKMAESEGGPDKGPLLALRSTTASILSQKHFIMPLDRCTELQVFGKRVLALSTIDSLPAHSFANELDSELNKILKSSAKYKLHSTKREKAWSEFHAFRCEKLNKIWKTLLTKLDISTH